MKRFIIAFSTVVAMVSCNKNEEFNSSSDEPLTVQFASSEIGTRTSGNSWIDGDRVGISMYSSGDLTTPVYENIEYSSDASGNFTEEGDEIYYPASGEVDFYAYYPYQSTMSDNLYLADISDQDDLGAIDLLWASLEGVSKTTSTQKFYFDHSLAMIELNVTLKYSLLTIAGTIVEIQGLNSTASFDMLTGEMIDGTADNPITLEMDVVEDAPTAIGSVERLTATLMVLPETMGEDVKVVFELPDGEVVSGSLSGEEFPAGTIKSYDVAVGYDEVTFFGSTLEPWAVEEEDKLISQETTDAPAAKINFSNSVLESILLDESRSHTPSKIDSDGDGEISTDEAALVTKIDAAGTLVKSVVMVKSSTLVLTSLDDMFNFENLTELDCSNNEITEIDLSANSALKSLDCSNNEITKIDLSANSSLENLNCSNNSITNLDLSNNSSLKSIDCSNNQIASLDLSTLTELIEGGVDCSGQKNEDGEEQPIVLLVTEAQTGEGGVLSDNSQTDSDIEVI